MRGGEVYRPPVNVRCGRYSDFGFILPGRLPKTWHPQVLSGRPLRTRPGRPPLRRRNRARISRASLNAPAGAGDHIGSANIASGYLCECTTVTGFISSPGCARQARV
jgi:hypothetical protein